MAWRIEKQADGRFAIWSTRIDDYIVIDADEAEIERIYKEKGIKVRPVVDAVRQLLHVRRDRGRRNVAFHHQIKPGQMDVDRLVGMQSAGMLHGVRLDGEMVHLSEQHGVAELPPNDLGEKAPALVRGVEVALVRDGIAGRHHQAAAGTA